MAHWAGVARRYARMGPPQVPTASVASRMRMLAGEGPAVLLGVTPALACAGTPLVACDGDARAVAALWPGDTPQRHAVVCDWRNLPCEDGTVAAVIGDGSLNVVAMDAVGPVLRECRRVLRPGGRIVLRLFAGPEPAEPAEAVLRRAIAGGYDSLNVIRWALAAALGDPETGAVRVADILGHAEGALGPLRDFAARMGLAPDDADFFESYRGTEITYLFPSRTTFASWARDAGLSTRFEETSGYPGAEACPIAVLQA